MRYTGEIKAVKSILPILGNNTTEGTGLAVDTAGYEQALMVAEIGASGDTLSGSVYMTINFQESSDGTNFTNISDDDLVGGSNGQVIDASNEDEVVIQRAYKGSKRYLRIQVAFTGTHTDGTPISGVVVLGHGMHQPAI